MHGQARAAAPVHVVDRGDFAHGLQKDAVELGQHLGEKLRSLGRGCDRIAEHMPAAGQERTDGGGVVALEHHGLAGGKCDLDGGTLGAGVVSRSRAPNS